MNYSFTMKTISRLTVTMIAFVAVLILSLLPLAGADKCPPTEPDSMGPFYKPNAPERSSIGSGYILAGVVRSTVDCNPVPKARIEVWQAGPNEQYDDAHRATLFSNDKGQYRLETDYPPRYSFWRPPHIHILVEAPGFRQLITQYYPKKGEKEGSFDLVLVPTK
jgi:protocatechuate 3,4-dioxygenase beta subunit